jgi:hypothetical protein
LTMEVLRSSETSVLTRVARRNISQDGILQGKVHPCNRPWKPMGLREVEASIFSKTTVSEMAVRLPTIVLTGRALPPGKISVLISVRG